MSRKPRGKVPSEVARFVGDLRQDAARAEARGEHNLASQIRRTANRVHRKARQEGVQAR